MVLFERANQSIELIDGFMNAVDQGMVIFREGIKNFLFSKQENFIYNLRTLLNLETEADIAKRKIEQLLFLLGGLAIAPGIFTNSKRVMETEGNGILSPGLPPLPLPESSTQVVIGSLIGIGMVKDVREVNFNMLGGIMPGWILTPLISCILTFIALFYFQNVFSLPVTNMVWVNTSFPEPISATSPAMTIDLIQPAIIPAGNQAMLLRLNFSTREISSLINISPKVWRYRDTV